MIKKLMAYAMIVFSTTAIAQQSTSSPYSFYGLGSLKFKGTVENQSMGGISVYSDSIHVNLRNPASYAGSNLSFYNNESRPIKFSIGTTFSNTKIETSSASDKYGNFSIDYLALALPINKFGFGFGIIPYSSVGYSLQSRNENDDLTFRYRGDGGINRVFLGFGYQILKGLKVGVDTHYNFGNITNTSIAFGYNDQGEMLQYQSRDDRRSDLGGFSFNFGVILDQKISESLDITASFTYTPQSEISSKNKNQFSTIAIDANQVEFVQTTYEIDLQAINLDNTNLVLPSKISFGAGIGKSRKWFLGFDYTLLEASKFSNRFVEIENSTFEDASSVSIGGFFIPKYDSFSSYWKRIVFRTGARFENTGLVVNNESIDEFGISFGLGLPVGRLFSNANIGFEWGRRGTTNANLVEENFYNINLSLSLNERWFEKRKFN
jgi:hypothetical protein|tara:strand:+ start:871 stop:2175 length:1305 start_codon:yes stop_codon:yes gene_type:complete